MFTFIAIKSLFTRVNIDKIFREKSKILIPNLRKKYIVGIAQIKHNITIFIILNSTQGKKKSFALNIALDYKCPLAYPRIFHMMFLSS